MTDHPTQPRPPGFGCDGTVDTEADLEAVEAMPDRYGEGERLAEFRRLGEAVFEEGPTD